MSLLLPYLFLSLFPFSSPWLSHTHSPFLSFSLSLSLSLSLPLSLCIHLLLVSIYLYLSFPSSFPSSPCRSFARALIPVCIKMKMDRTARQMAKWIYAGRGRNFHFSVTNCMCLACPPAARRIFERYFPVPNPGKRRERYATFAGQ